MITKRREAFQVHRIGSENIASLDGAKKGGNNSHANKQARDDFK